MRLKDLDDQWLLRDHFFGIYEIEEEGNDQWARGEVYLPNPQDQSQRLDKAVINNAIASAISWLENNISARIRHSEEIVEHHDYDLDLFNEHMTLTARKYPITTLTSLKLVYGENGATLWDVDRDMIQIKPGSRFGIVNVLPMWGIGINYDPAISLLFPGAVNRRMAPSMFELTYNAGMDGATEDLDMMVVRAIGLRAAVHPFNIMGDIVLGAGIASVSNSIDGLSQSIQTTSSAENSAYSARIIMHRKELYGEQGTPGLLEDLKKEWRRPPLGLL